MRVRISNAALIVLGLALLPSAAQAPTGGQGQPAETIALQSLPGALGRELTVTQPPVPVPPGPVPPSQIKPAPPTPIAVKKVELGDDETWDPQWDVLIEENLPPELLSSDLTPAVKSLCPRFRQMSEADKRAYWAYFFQALAGAEAGLKPTANVRHMDPEVAVLDTVTHRTVRQQGLLQLTYMDAQRYGCDFNWQKDKSLAEHDPEKTILQPENNLLCGIRILKNQVIDLHESLLTPKSYWATLRPGTMSYRVFAKQMTNVPVACGVKPTQRKRVVEQSAREAFVSMPDPSQASGSQ